ncbi:histidine kinase [Muricauda sp. 2012CJ35-5]|uniref:Histidine kinase n=1 Tax=Flagellimonas spongiicola TaxID=2942208 RepID=A0ABT0PSU7_9FLAO|nr:histidine kinase [Allomuricauda spongiicola]MCL6274336.1 histidine kinase [Allomuricauda spongiicola]
MNNDQFEDILIYFSKSLLGKENEEEILWDLAKNCIAKLGFVDCVVYLLDDELEVLVQKAAYGPKNPKDYSLHNPVAIPLGTGITGTVAESRVAEIIPDTSLDNRYIVDDDQRLSEICVPIYHEDVVYGVIDCEHPERDFFTKQHLKMLAAIASIAAIKMKNVRSQKALRDEQANLLAIKEEMMNLKLQALNSQLNPHFVFNALNSIQYYVTAEDKKSALEYLSTFSKLVRFNLSHLGTEVVLLEDELKMLQWYLKLQKMRYDEHLEYHINVNDPVGIWDAMIPATLVQTLMDNIIEYAMSSPNHKEVLDIDITIQKEYVVLEISYGDKEMSYLADTNPQYSERNTRFLDQIRLLNTHQGYTITKEEYFEPSKKGGVVVLTLPIVG